MRDRQENLVALAGPRVRSPQREFGAVDSVHSCPFLGGQVKSALSSSLSSLSLSLSIGLDLDFFILPTRFSIPIFFLNSYFFLLTN